KKSFLSNGSIKNLSTPLLLSASFISAIQAEARGEDVPSARVTDSPLSGATGLSPAFSGLGAAGPGPVRGPTFSGPDANIFGARVPVNGPAAIPGARVTGNGPDAIPGAPVPGNGPAAIPGAPVPGHCPDAIPGSPRGRAVPGDDAAVPAFSGLGDAIIAEAGPGAAAAFSGHGIPIHGAADPGAAIPGAISDPGSVRGAAFSGHAAAVPGHAAGPAGPDHGPAFSGLVPAVPGAGHSVVGGSEPLDSRSVVTSSSQGGNGKTTPVSVSSDEQIASPEEVLPHKETGSQGTSSPEGQPTVSSNNEKQRN
ncbi:mucin-associated surface protein (MASP), partial [Trypanosoma cruzi]